ncbi:serine/threonine protein kinase [Nostoc sp.]|uniref:serine/threonine protein kinase n=1 Tax=Nostoc sp. TaxID=1180 RepID=UPI002FF752F0
MAWIAGDRLQGGKYTIEEKLGRGKFGITYLVRNKNGDLVVIKTLDDQHRNQPDFNRLQQNFVREAFKLAKCQHPNIVRLLEEPFQEDGLWCIAMEYIAGVDLAHRSQNILPESEALHYIQQISEALGESCSKFHTFLILASVSSLGLSLGWLGHRIFNTGL